MLRWMGLLLLLHVSSLGAQEPRVRITFDAKVQTTPFTGRVFVMAWKQPVAAAPAKPKWVDPDPFFARDVRDWKPGEPLVFGSDSLGYPQPLAKLPAGKYWIQAVLDRRQGGQNAVAAPGNGYSKAVVAVVEPGQPLEATCAITETIAEPKFPEKPRVKLCVRESPLLSAFHGKPMRLRAGVVLPKSYAEEPTRKYPLVLEIPGFTGDHFLAFGAESRNATDLAGVEVIYAMLDPACVLGHHVFADSANNGPYGRALIEEFLPYLEKEFRAIGTPAARLLTGHSSGGWSSLWLQTRYPKVFGGTWSTAPDSVDFRDFQKVDIYPANVNLFTDEQGQPRPLGRKGGKVFLTYKGFSDFEAVLGRGGQLASFEAVFGPRGGDGQPLKLWDRRTGQVDAKVAHSWEPYDIRLRLERDWDRLKGDLAGKLHVYMGAEDNFYLDGATRLLQASLRKLGGDAVIELFPGKDHSTLMDANLRARIAKEMANRLRLGATRPASSLHFSHPDRTFLFRKEMHHEVLFRTVGHGNRGAGGQSGVVGREGAGGQDERR